MTTESFTNRIYKLYFQWIKYEHIITGLQYHHRLVKIMLVMKGFLVIFIAASSYCLTPYLDIPNNSAQASVPSDVSSKKLLILFRQLKDIRIYFSL